MNPPCARCKKTVYPMDKLNCLDKYWHKQCFRCFTCQMTLSMKNYKGYNKEPYCNAHYPSTKFTAVADTPENRRLAKNTAQQSNIVYHKEFESEKGKYTAVEDDPETRRLKKSAQQASDIAYKGQTQQARPRVSQEEQAPAFIPPQPAPVAAPAAAPAPAPAQPQSDRYRALYDYTAADDDEVSFVEGDVVVNAEIIDEGWMTGTIQSTGQHGMLPANYVEKI